jgi:hypothetical protein
MMTLPGVSIRRVSHAEVSPRPTRPTLRILSSDNETEFISHKNNRGKRGRALKTDPKLDGGRISDELKILMNVDASNNLADDANA